MPNGAKPGYKTTEFWVSLAAMIVGAILASGIENPMLLKIFGIAATVLTAMGYQVSRAMVKK